MKALVIVESFFGNTEKIAQAIARKLDAPVVRACDASPSDLQGLDLLVVGSPTRGFRPTPDTLAFLDQLPPRSLDHLVVAAFDTRIDLETIRSAAFRFLVKSGGYAAKTIGKKLQKKGGKLAVTPEGFLVLDTEGPLKAGELERAAAWAESLKKIHLPEQVA